MIKFNMGDRVMLREDSKYKDSNWYSQYIGHIGTILDNREHYEDFWIQIEWDDGNKHFMYYTKDLIKVIDNTELNQLFDELCEEL